MGQNHRVKIEFRDGYISGKLIHPEEGCQSVPPKNECWIQAWFDNYMLEEFLEGSVEVEIEMEIPTDDTVYGKIK